MVPHGDESCPEPAPRRRGGSSTPEQRSLAASIAALTLAATRDSTVHAQVMQAGLVDKFRREVLDADPKVVEPELTRRAELLRRAHMKRLALKSAKVRAQRKGAA